MRNAITVPEEIEQEKEDVKVTVLSSTKRSLVRF
jgi:hypothetical protein